MTTGGDVAAIRVEKSARIVSHSVLLCLLRDDPQNSCDLI